MLEEIEPQSVRGTRAGRDVYGLEERSDEARGGIHGERIPAQGEEGSRPAPPSFYLDEPVAQAAGHGGGASREDCERARPQLLVDREPDVHDHADDEPQTSGRDETERACRAAAR